MLPMPVADAIRWAQRFLWEIMQITLDGPSAFTRNSVNNIGWAQTCHKYLLQMLLGGPSIYLGSSANYFGWAQCFPETFC